MAIIVTIIYPAYTVNVIRNDQFLIMYEFIPDINFCAFIVILLVMLSECQSYPELNRV